MKTIVIQLLKSMVLFENEYYGIRHFGDSMEDYAPVGIYDYYKLGKKKIMATLNPDRLTSDLIPMLREFYSEYGDKKYFQQYSAVLQELNKNDTLSFEKCEKFTSSLTADFDQLISG